MLELKNISYKVDNKTILDNINLKFDYGKIIAITGHNGSGKSTLVKLIMGIINQTSGDLILDGQNINDLNITKRARLGIGFTFQQPVKFKGLTVSNLLETAIGGELNIKCGCDYLSKVGLCAKDYLFRELDSNLSGGELKRIELAIALAENKKINIEYVSANPTGYLHIGHCRGAAYGDSLARIMKKAGFEVSREFYVNDAGNQIKNLGHSIFERYKELADKEEKVIFGGRLAEYKYYDMDKVIASAFQLVEKELG